MFSPLIWLGNKFLKTPLNNIFFVRCDYILSKFFLGIKNIGVRVFWINFLPDVTLLDVLNYKNMFVLYPSRCFS